MSADTLPCGGCGRPLRWASAAGIGVVRGQAFTYVLCQVCAAAAKIGPSQMAEVIELRLLDAQGNA